MAKTFRRADGSVIRVEFTAEEMAEKVLKIRPGGLMGQEMTPAERLAKWQDLIKPFRGKGKDAIYAIRNDKELKKIQKRAALLNTNMTTTAVRNVEKAGLLDAYAALAEDCPPGITAHVWRSYGLVVLMQTRYGKMIGAKELAQRANINCRDENGKIVPDVEKAEKHLRLLQALDYLSVDSEGRRWNHKGLPASWQKDK